MSAEPALSFFLDLVTEEGGAIEPGGESALVLLPGHLQETLDLPEVLSVTSDAEVADEEDALLLIEGQPVLLRASEGVIARGDAGWCHLPWPSTPPPAAGELQEAAREQLSVEHGRVDLEGQPVAAYLPLLRVGALIEHRVSMEDRLVEEAEVLLHPGSGRPAGEREAGALLAAASSPGRGTGRGHVELDLVHALAAAHRLLEERAVARQAVLAREQGSALRRERQQVDLYYEAALASIEKRREGASPERRALYDAQGEATRAEWARRLRETEEKFGGSYDILPFRLQVLEVPALVVPVVVRRGDRRFPFHLEWLLPLAAFAPSRCPVCGSAAPLVAGKEVLGCRACVGAPKGEGVLPAGPARSPEAGRTRLEHEPEPQPEPEAQPEPDPDPEQGGAVEQDRPEVELSRRASRASMPAEQVRRLERVWRDLGLQFWASVAGYERWAGVAPHSPLEALYRCYDVRGPLCALGLPPATHLRAMRASVPDAEPGGLFSMSGSLETAGGKFPFTLRFRMVARSASLVEVLPFRGTRQDGALPPRQQVHPSVAARLYEEAPRPARMGPVEEALFSQVAIDGLPLLLRELALYWRLQGQRRLAAVGTAALAGALAVSAARQSGQRPGIAAVARRYRVAPAELKEACEVIDHLVKLGAGRSW